jgi:AcrR family transcriptional regulator
MCSDRYKRKYVMVSKEQQRQRATALIAEHLLAAGLSETSLRQLAGAAQVSDRMLLYYFTDKADVILSALSHVVGAMTALLASAIPENANLSPKDLIAKALGVTQGGAMRPYMRLWIEIVAAAARGEQPYKSVSSQIALGFLAWIESRLTGEESDAKRATAAMVFAIIDGIALLDVCAGPDQSELAVRALSELVFPSQN